MGEELRRDPFLGLVAVEEVVAEAADGIVEGDGDVCHRLALVVHQREHREGERERRLLVAAVRRAVRRPLGEVRAKELVGAVDQVQAHRPTIGHLSTLLEWPRAWRAAGAARLRACDEW